MDECEKIRLHHAHTSHPRYVGGLFLFLPRNMIVEEGILMKKLSVLIREKNEIQRKFAEIIGRQQTRGISENT